MLTMGVAPNLKFSEGSEIHPWVIPIGLGFHVNGPLLHQVQYWVICVQYGAGFEYQV